MGVPVTKAGKALGQPLTYHPKIARFFKSVKIAVFYSQLLYWSTRTDEPLGVYKSAEEWEQETGLTYREQATARAALVQWGFMVETHKRLQHRIYFCLIEDAIDAAFEVWESTGKSPNDESAIGEKRKKQSAADQRRNVGSPNDENAVRGQHETQPGSRTEITAETTALLPAPPAAAPGTELVPAKPKKEPPTEEQTAHKLACGDTWDAYCQAYTQRYGVAPVRNAPANAQIKQLVLRLGQQEAPGVARFYVEQVHERFVVQQLHPLYLLLRSAEAYRTQWVRGQAMTSTRAAQADKTAANYNTVDEAMAIMAARDERGRDAYR